MEHDEADFAAAQIYGSFDHPPWNAHPKFSFPRNAMVRTPSNSTSLAPCALFVFCVKVQLSPYTCPNDATEKNTCLPPLLQDIRTRSAATHSQLQLVHCTESPPRRDPSGPSPLCRFLIFGKISHGFWGGFGEIPHVYFRCCIPTTPPRSKGAFALVRGNGSFCSGARERGFCTDARN